MEAELLRRDGRKELGRLARCSTAGRSPPEWIFLVPRALTYVIRIYALLSLSLPTEYVQSDILFCSWIASSYSAHLLIYRKSGMPTSSTAYKREHMQGGIGVLSAREILPSDAKLLTLARVACSHVRAYVRPSLSFTDCVDFKVRTSYLRRKFEWCIQLACSSLHWCVK